MPKKSGTDIDKIRDSAFSFEIPGSGEIEQMVSLNEEFIFLCQNGVYRFQHADKTDPSRKNPDILNTVQCVFPFNEKYTYSQWIFRTALALFAENSGLRKGIKTERVLSKSISIARDFWDIETQLKRLVEVEKTEQSSFRKRPIENNTIILPSAPDYRPAFTGFLIKASHIWRELLDILKECFLGNPCKKGYDGFSSYLIRKYGSDDPFCRFSSDSLYQLNSLRNARNALEHPDESKSVDFRDYTLTEENIIFLPAIRIRHPETPHDYVSASMYMEKMTENLAYIVEGYLVFSCVYNPIEIGKFRYSVEEIEERKGQHRLERYGWRLTPKVETENTISKAEE